MSQLIADRACLARLGRLFETSLDLLVLAEAVGGVEEESLGTLNALALMVKLQTA